MKIINLNACFEDGKIKCATEMSDWCITCPNCFMRKTLEVVIDGKEENWASEKTCDL